MVNNAFTNMFSNGFANNPFANVSKDGQAMLADLQDISNRTVEKFVRNVIQVSAQMVASTVQNSQKFDFKNPEEFYKNAAHCSADMLQTMTDYMSSNWNVLSNALTEYQNLFATTLKKPRVKTCNEEQ